MPDGWHLPPMSEGRSCLGIRLLRLLILLLSTAPHSSMGLGTLIPGGSTFALCLASSPEPGLWLWPAPCSSLSHSSLLGCVLYGILKLLFKKLVSFHVCSTVLALSRVAGDSTEMARRPLKTKLTWHNHQLQSLLHTLVP